MNQSVEDPVAADLPSESVPADAIQCLAGALLEVLPFGVVLLSRSKGVLHTNPRARAILGEAGIDTMGWDGSEVAAIVTTLGLPALDAEDHWTGSVRLVGSGGPHDVELRVLALDAEHRAVVLTPVPPARQAEDNARVLAALVAQSSDFVAWHGPIGAEARVNRAAADLVGGEVEPGTPLPHKIRDLFEPDSRDRIEELGVPAMHEFGSWRNHLRVRNRDSGEVREIDWMQFIVRDEAGRVLGSAGVGRDVTDEVRVAAQALQRQMLAAQEAERRSIAAAVHDDSAQVLFALGLRLERLGRRLDGENRSLVDDARQSAATALDRLRRLIFDLHATALDTGSIATALRDFLAFAFDDNAPPVVVSGDDEGAGLNPEARAALYRATREVLLNASRHAKASRIEVCLEPIRGGLLIRVADDGVGFDLAGDTRRPGHLGLTSAGTLIQAAGGQLDIESVPGLGTTVTMWVPAAP